LLHIDQGSRQKLIGEGVSMDLRSHLDSAGCHYSWSRHGDCFTARGLAQREHVPAGHVIKPVLVSVDGEFVLCALPASHRIDLSLLRMEVGAEEIRLANEEELAGMCGDCELGAEPPIGWLFGLPTFMDESLFDDGQVTFQAGNHREAVTMSFMDYFRLAKPAVGHFGQAPSEARGPAASEMTNA
jgi:Ala-tRNA(Pro) deacylase